MPRRSAGWWLRRKNAHGFRKLPEAIGQGVCGADTIGTRHIRQDDGNYYALANPRGGLFDCRSETLWHALTMWLATCFLIGSELGDEVNEIYTQPSLTFFLKYVR